MRKITSTQAGLILFVDGLFFCLSLGVTVKQFEQANCDAILKSHQSINVKRETTCSSASF